MSCKIVIPSLSRADILKNRTLKVLNEYKIDPKSIYVFIVANEYHQYLEAIDNPHVNIVCGVKGISEQRSFISQFFDEGTFILTLDDDIKCISELDNGKLNNLFSLQALNDKVYDLIKKGGTCGIYPCNNPFFMKNYTSTNLKFVIGCMRWFINDKELECSREFKLLEDYETSIKYFMKYGTITRMNHITVDHDFNGKIGGGLASVTDRGYNTKKKEVDKFFQKYKRHCSINDRVLSNGKKIDIRFKKIRKLKFKE